MDIFVSRKDNDLLEISQEKFTKPFLATKDNYFGFIIKSIDGTRHVTNMEYSGNSLSVEKYTFLDGSFFIENYFFDESLVQDSDFVKRINDLLEYYSRAKDDIKSFIDECISLREEKNKLANQARQIFREYCLTGSVTIPDDESNLKKIYEMFNSCSIEIFIYYERDENNIIHKYHTVSLDELVGPEGGIGSLSLMSKKAKEVAAILKEKGLDVLETGNKVFTKKDS